MPLSETDAEQLIGAICFKTGPPGTIGAELEWLVRDSEDPLLAVPFSRIQQVYDALSKPGILPAAGLLTLEPGGQVELSTAPAKDLADCIAAASDDLARPARGIRDAGSRSHRSRPRSPPPSEPGTRAAAIRGHGGILRPATVHWGRLMMCSTASVQVCVDAGLDDDGISGYQFRWRLLHALGPGARRHVRELTAAAAAQPTGWKCTRQLVWSRLDPCRTRAPAGAEPTCGQAAGPGLAVPRQSGLRPHGTLGQVRDGRRRALRAQAGRTAWTVPSGLTFRDWLRGSGQPRAPGRQGADVPGRRRPMTSAITCPRLFPPVQAARSSRAADDRRAARRRLDRPGRRGRALADDPSQRTSRDGGGRAGLGAHGSADAGAQYRGSASGGRTGTRPTPWLRAARLGPEDPVIARAASECFEAATAALARSEAPVRDQDRGRRLRRAIRAAQPLPGRRHPRQRRRT